MDGIHREESFSWILIKEYIAVVKLYFTKTEKAKTHSEEFARDILGEYLNVDGNCLMILKGEYGKPYLRDYPDTNFNISHTKDAIVCAMADKPVGVDVESVKPFNKRIVERFFTQNEQDYIFVSKEGQDERFAEIWTKKESYIKCSGKGMAIPFESFDVLSFKEASKIYCATYQEYCITIYVDDSLLK